MSTETMEVASLVIFLVVVAIMVYQQYRAGKNITIADVTRAVEAARPITERVRTVAERVVLAIEQIKRQGKITNDEAFSRAFVEIRKQFPPASRVTDAEIIQEINRAALIASNLTAQIKAAKKDGKPDDPSSAKAENDVLRIIGNRPPSATTE